MVDWITIYTRSDPPCSWCVKMKELLGVYGYDFYEKDISKEERYKKEFLEGGWRIVPQVVVEGVVIGGYETSKDYFRRRFLDNHPRKNEVLEELERLE